MLCVISSKYKCFKLTFILSRRFAWYFRTKLHIDYFWRNPIHILYIYERKIDFLRSENCANHTVNNFFFHITMRIRFLEKRRKNTQFGRFFLNKTHSISESVIFFYEKYNDRYKITTCLSYATNKTSTNFYIYTIHIFLLCIIILYFIYSLAVYRYDERGFFFCQFLRYDHVKNCRKYHLFFP